MNANTDRWTIARAKTKCRRCPMMIGAGEPFRLVTSVGLAHCPACALELFDETPPDDLPVKPLFTWQPPTTDTTMPRDFKVAQYGRDDD